MINVVCFGNSVTQALPHVSAEDAFVAVLERRINRRLEVLEAANRVRCVNAGVGGENTAEGLARIDEEVLALGPQLVIVEFGLNDLRYEPEKYLPEDEYAANLRTIRDLCRRSGAGVLFTTPNPIIDSVHGYSKGISFYDRWQSASLDGGLPGCLACRPARAARLLPREPMRPASRRLIHGHVYSCCRLPWH